MTDRIVLALKAGAGGLAVALVMVGIAVAGHVLDQIYPCRATDPYTGESRAVSCLYEPPQQGGKP